MSAKCPKLILISAILYCEKLSNVHPLDHSERNLSYFNKLFFFAREYRQSIITVLRFDLNLYYHLGSNSSYRNERMIKNQAVDNSSQTPQAKAQLIVFLQVSSPTF